MKILVDTYFPKSADEVFILIKGIKVFDGLEEHDEAVGKSLNASNFAKQAKILARYLRRVQHTYKLIAENDRKGFTPKLFVEAMYGKSLVPVLWAVCDSSGLHLHRILYNLEVASTREAIRNFTSLKQYMEWVSRRLLSLRSVFEITGMIEKASYMARETESSRKVISRSGLEQHHRVSVISGLEVEEKEEESYDPYSIDDVLQELGVSEESEVSANQGNSTASSLLALQSSANNDYGPKRPEGKIVNAHVGSKVLEAASKKRSPCIQHLRKKCDKGDKCEYSHSIEVIAQFVKDIIQLFPELKSSASMSQIISGWLDDAEHETDTDIKGQIFAAIRSVTAQHPAEAQFTIMNPSDAGRHRDMEPNT
jgi:hypothetical protein